VTKRAVDRPEEMAPHQLRRQIDAVTADYFAKLCRQEEWRRRQLSRLMHPDHPGIDVPGGSDGGGGTRTMTLSRRYKPTEPVARVQCLHETASAADHRTVCKGSGRTKTSRADVPGRGAPMLPSWSDGMSMRLSIILTLWANTNNRQASRQATMRADGTEAWASVIPCTAPIYQCVLGVDGFCFFSRLVKNLTSKVDGAPRVLSDPIMVAARRIVFFRAIIRWNSSARSAHRIWRMNPHFDCWMAHYSPMRAMTDSAIMLDCRRRWLKIMEATRRAVALAGDRAMRLGRLGLTRGMAIDDRGILYCLFLDSPRASRERAPRSNA